MLVSTYMLAGHRHHTMRPGSSRASHYQHAGRRTDTAKPLQIAPGRDRASSPIVGAQHRLHDVRQDARNPLSLLHSPTLPNRGHTPQHSLNIDGSKKGGKQGGREGQGAIYIGVRMRVYGAL